jgi:hypothetical protein
MSNEPEHYELRVEGHLDEHWSAWFGGLALVREPDGTTTLSGAVADQAELHGLLAKIRDLGACLLSVNPSDPAGVSRAAPTLGRPGSRRPPRRTTGPGDRAG